MSYVSVCIFFVFGPSASSSTYLTMKHLSVRKGSNHNLVVVIIRPTSLGLNVSTFLK